MSGPTTITLHPDRGGNGYTGTVHFDVYNNGTVPADLVRVFLTLPTGVNVSPGGDGVQFSGCVQGGVVSPEAWVCMASTVPVTGTHLTFSGTVTVAASRQAASMKIDGLKFRVALDSYQDVSPADNTIAVSIVLSPN